MGGWEGGSKLFFPSTESEKFWGAERTALKGSDDSKLFPLTRSDTIGLFLEIKGSVLYWN